MNIKQIKQMGVKTNGYRLDRLRKRGIMLGPVVINIHSGVRSDMEILRRWEDYFVGLDVPFVTIFDGGVFTLYKEVYAVDRE